MASGYTDTATADTDTYYLQVLQEAAQHSHQAVTRAVKCPESYHFTLLLDILPQHDICILFGG